MNTKRTSASNCAETVPTRYELVDKDGKVWGGSVFNSAVEAGKCAALLWPDQEQDEDRAGKGWDVQVVGCE